MTIDDEKSVYAGGLPYDATGEKIRDAFQFYGSVVAVKVPSRNPNFSSSFHFDFNFTLLRLMVINDHRVGEKCYWFVTCRNLRSAYIAIREMNGKTIGGRVVKVNEVNIRGGTWKTKSRSRKGTDRERARDRERDYDRDRDRHQDHVRDNSWDRDQESNREYEQHIKDTPFNNN
ncbi:RNA recognition motif domain [Dillenia turbinata]|uniref:RNA recognition motif domain n=1 Tax=Dillenia turbinata TaxID=194707 RepID=A0AAN8VXF6_9MAGN